MCPRLKWWVLVLCAALAAARVSSVLAGAAGHAAAPAEKPAATPPAPAPGAEETPVAPGELEFKARVLPAQPAAGKGRLSLAMDGSRRWCTYRGDRVSSP